jgi:methylmalonyl-CoA mutase N-terminal domain/subunit
MSNDTSQRILRRVPYQEGFRFSKGIGDYTGQVATSLDDFAELLKTIDLKSIDFHMERNDFEKWVLDVFGDEELGHMINRRANFVGENRRNELITTVKAHLEDLRKMPKSV